MLNNQLRHQVLLQDKVPYYLYCLFGIAIPQPLHLERIVVVLLFICCAFLIIYRGKAGLRSSLPLPALLPVLFILLHVIGLFYSDDLVTGWKAIETKLALLVVPLYISLVWPVGLSSKRIYYILLSFIISCSAAYLYVLLRALLLSFNGSSLDASQVLFAFSRDNLASYLSQHPIYIALIAVCCVQVLIYLLTEYWKDYSFLKRSALLFSLFTSLAIVILMGARLSLIALAFTVFIWLSLLIIRQRKYFLGTALIITLILSISLSVIYVPNINVRFKEIADTEFTPPKGAYHNSTNLRVGQLYCSIESIKNNYLFGTGTGDFQTVLNSCYKENGFSDVLYLLNYNSHNQYLQSLLTLGVLGIVLLVIIVNMPIMVSLTKGDWLMAMLFIVFSLSMLTESVLQTNKGIMVFSFIYGLYLIRILSDSNKEQSSYNIGAFYK